jgi:hypothetical protein
MRDRGKTEVRKGQRSEVREQRSGVGGRFKDRRLEDEMIRRMDD